MNERLIRARLMIVFVLSALSLVVWLPVTTDSSARDNFLTVSFLDVGQGDAIFIETPDNVQVLVDGGRDGQVLRELAKVMDFSDRTIDLVVGTHPDSDHIGGLIDVFERYEIEQVLLTENEGESEAANEYLRLVESEGSEIVYARRGQSFSLGASTTMEVLWPETDVSGAESNASSIVLKLTYGETSFLLTGDSPKRIEEYLVLAFGEHLKSTVLKVGHHGSRTSTAELFLAEVDPEYAVLSYGSDNRYGHPHVEVTDLLFNQEVSVLSTAEQGTITFLSDGSNLSIE